MVIQNDTSLSSSGSQNCQWQQHTEIIHKKKCGFLTWFLVQLHLLTDLLQCLIAQSVKPPQIVGKIILKCLRTLTALLFRWTFARARFPPAIINPCSRDTRAAFSPEKHHCSSLAPQPFTLQSVSQTRGVLHSCDGWWMCQKSQMRNSKWEGRNALPSTNPARQDCPTTWPGRTHVPCHGFSQWFWFGQLHNTGVRHTVRVQTTFTKQCVSQSALWLAQGQSCKVQEKPLIMQRKRKEAATMDLLFPSWNEPKY